MKLKFFISARFPDLNDVLRMTRAHFNRVNSEWIHFIMYEILAADVARLSFREPVSLVFTWHEDVTGRGRGRDPDNVSWAKKFVLDALVKMEILAGDSHKEIECWEDRFMYGNRQGVEVEIVE